LAGSIGTAVTKTALDHTSIRHFAPGADSRDGCCRYCCEQCESYASSFVTDRFARHASEVSGLGGFTAAIGWDPATGIGSPIAANMVDILIGNVSPGDGQFAISSSKFSADKGPKTKGPKQPH
jgi:hypothetical protein